MLLCCAGGGTLRSHRCAVDRKSNGVLIFVMRFMSRPGKSAKLRRVQHVSKITLSNLLLFSLILECAQDPSTCPPVATRELSIPSCRPASQTADGRCKARPRGPSDGETSSTSPLLLSFVPICPSLLSILFICHWEAIFSRLLPPRSEITSHYSTQQTASSSSSYKRMHICRLETALPTE